MALNKIEIQLTPQNEEMINSIPNRYINLDTLFNVLLEDAIESGKLLTAATNTLNVKDLSKFKSTYVEILNNRKANMVGLDKPIVETQKPTDRDILIMLV